MRRWTWMALALIVLAPAPLWAWGQRGHHLVNAGAVSIVPEPLHGFLARQEDEIVAHAIDPDLWAEKRVYAPPWTHYINLDALDNAPFAGIPRDEASAAAKFGAEALRKAGTLPWEIARREQELTAAFRDRRWDDVIREATWLGHYVADSTMPLHMTKDYQGRSAGNVVLPERGSNRTAHQRIETGVLEHYRDRYGRVRGNPANVRRLDDALGATWRTARETFALVPQALLADRQASEADPTFGATFYADLDAREGAVLKEQLARAQERLASAWLTAWEDAGRPALPTTRVSVRWPDVSARTPRPVKRAHEAPALAAGLTLTLIVLGTLLRMSRRRIR